MTTPAPTPGIGIGNVPPHPSAYCVDMEHAHVACRARAPRSRYICTAPAGHLRDEIPHIACGITHELVPYVVAIWDELGRELAVDVAPIGATL